MDEKILDMAEHTIDTLNSFEYHLKIIDINQNNKFNWNQFHNLIEILN
jgi:hypothetical protein